jgi:hypothetical protein
LIEVENRPGTRQSPSVIRWISSLVLVLVFACANVASASTRAERLYPSCDAEDAELMARVEIAYTAFLDHFQPRTGLFTLNDPINLIDLDGLNPAWTRIGQWLSTTPAGQFLSRQADKATQAIYRYGQRGLETLNRLRRPSSQPKPCPRPLSQAELEAIEEALRMSLGDKMRSSGVLGPLADDLRKQGYTPQQIEDILRGLAGHNYPPS